MVEHLRERVAIEEDYARRLAKLGRTALDTQGFGMMDKADDQPSTLKLAWQQVAVPSPQAPTEAPQDTQRHIQT
jgi:hypothetical protein